jgi:hypothetical protein
MEDYAVIAGSLFLIGLGVTGIFCALAWAWYEYRNRD